VLSEGALEQDFRILPYTEVDVFGNWWLYCLLELVLHHYDFIVTNSLYLNNLKQFGFLFVYTAGGKSEAWVTTCRV
jgi:hypothetical protein